MTEPEFKVKYLILPEVFQDALRQHPYTRESYHIVNFHYDSGAYFRRIRVYDCIQAEVHSDSPLDMTKVVSMSLTP